MDCPRLTVCCLPKARSGKDALLVHDAIWQLGGEDTGSGGCGGISLAR